MRDNAMPPFSLSKYALTKYGLTFVSSNSITYRFPLAKTFRSSGTDTTATLAGVPFLEITRLLFLTQYFSNFLSIDLINGRSSLIIPFCILAYIKY